MNRKYQKTKQKTSGNGWDSKRSNSQRKSLNASAQKPSYGDSRQDDQPHLGRSQQRNTSWDSSSRWYDQIVGEKGHYYHWLIIPKLIKLLDLKPKDALVDIGCGQGVLARRVSEKVTYFGLDNAKKLIQSAQEREKKDNRSYKYWDITRNAPELEMKFSHAAMVLSLQNMDKPAEALKHSAELLKENGKLVIVLNHPCFRIPRQSSWEVDKTNKLSYRRINRYLSPLSIPIKTNPSNPNSALTWSFHHSLSDISVFLKEAGFITELMEEWVSDKESQGKAAKMENRGRSEFPLFLAIVCRKVSS